MMGERGEAAGRTTATASGGRGGEAREQYRNGISRRGASPAGLLVACTAVAAWSAGCTLSNLDELVSGSPEPRDAGTMKAAGEENAASNADAVAEPAGVPLDSSSGGDAPPLAPTEVSADAPALTDSPQEAGAGAFDPDSHADPAGDASPLPPGSIEPADGGARSADTGPRGDASDMVGIDAGGLHQDGGAQDASVGPAHGVLYRGVFWHLSAAGANCVDTCRDHGGVDPIAERYVGTPRQGGDVSSCEAIFAVLVSPGEVGSRRSWGTVGLGCYRFADDQRWWLERPDFDPSHSSRGAEIVCGCLE